MGYGTFSLANFSVGDANDVDLSGISDGDALLYNSTSGNFEAGPVDALPSQSGNSGKYLTTDGTDASWGTVDLSTKVSKTGDTMTGTLTFGSANNRNIFNTSGATTGYSYGMLSNTGGTLLLGVADSGAGFWSSGSSSAYMGTIGTTGSTAFSIATNNTTRLNIDSSGRVTMPYQPSFRIGRNSGDISSGSVILFNSTYHNTGSHYNAANGRFTAPIAGRYLIGFTGFNVSGTSTQTILRKNGSNIGYSLSYGATYTMLTQVMVVELAVNDYVDVYVSAGFVYASGSVSDCTFTGHLIG